jgi:hypothetical protein
MQLSDYLCLDLKEKGLPLCLLTIIKLAIEKLYAILGFFIALSLFVGLTLSACPESILMQLAPMFMGFLFFLYIGVIFFAIPLFLITDKLRQPQKKIIRFVILVLVFCFAYYALMEAPIFDLLVTYVKKLFPHATECKGEIVNFYLD